MIDLGVRQGEFFTLLGPSGCGKTTTLRMIAGFELPTGGEILISGQPMTRVPPYARPVNTVFQNYALFPHLTVAQNVGFGLKVARVARAERDQRVARGAGAGAAAADGRAARLGALRRAAAAGGAGPRADQPACRAAARRAARRAGPEAAQRATGRAQAGAARRRHHLYLCHPRPGGGADHVRPHRGDARRQVQQIADARTIYDQPATCFVADFIGETNFLPARITTASNGREHAVAQRVRCLCRRTAAWS